MKSKTAAPPPVTDWPRNIWDVLKKWDARLIAHVPDAGHKRLLELCDRDRSMTVAPLATEEDGVALLAGAWLGGLRGALLVQSSGVGNCINMLGLPSLCRLPLLMLVTMRGEWGEFNPWQVPMGQAVQPVLEQMGCLVFRAEQADQVGATVDAAARMAFEGPQPVALLLAQKLIGAKAFSDASVNK
jgi:sulfopyruvate decarboxylase alpha subunit